MDCTMRKSWGPCQGSLRRLLARRLLARGEQKPGCSRHRSDEVDAYFEVNN